MNNAKTYKKIFAWAKKESGYTWEEIADGIGISKKKLMEQIEDETTMNVNLLRKFADFLKRPMIIFYINEVPETCLPEEYYTLGPIERIKYREEFPRRQEIELFARQMHEWYEKIAEECDWETQIDCSVDFDDLPEENREVMLKLSEKILTYLDKI